MPTTGTPYSAQVRLARRYTVLGIVAGLVAPVGLLLGAIIMHRTPDPIWLFFVLAIGGTTIFGMFGRIIGHRDELLMARNRELALLSAELRKLSTIDALTGISNRRNFDDRLRMELDRSARYGVPCSLVMMDLDHFKALNDSFGHQAGDEILRRIGTLLRSECRSGDMVARYGGEEFAAILTNVDGEAARVWSERVRARLVLERVRWEGSDLSITSSFGVAAAPTHAKSVTNLLEAADGALYEAKHRGGNNTVVTSTRDTSPASGMKLTAGGV